MKAFIDILLISAALAGIMHTLIVSSIERPRKFLWRLLLSVILIAMIVSAGLYYNGSYITYILKL